MSISRDDYDCYGYDEDEYDVRDMNNSCPECGSLDVEYFDDDVDRCVDCGYFFESENFDDDQESMDRMRRHGEDDDYWDD